MPNESRPGTFIPIVVSRIDTDPLTETLNMLQDFVGCKITDGLLAKLNTVLYMVDQMAEERRAVITVTFEQYLPEGSM